MSDSDIGSTPCHRSRDFVTEHLALVYDQCQLGEEPGTLLIP